MRVETTFARRAPCHPRAWCGAGCRLPAVRLSPRARPGPGRLGVQRRRRRGHRSAGPGERAGGLRAAPEGRRAGAGARRGGRGIAATARAAGCGVLHPAQSRGPGDDIDPARHRHLRRLPARTARPGRPALPLRLHQLHAVRPALYADPSLAVRPLADQHGELRAVPGLPARVHRSAAPAFSRRAQRLPGVRADVAPGGCARRRAARRPDRGDARVAAQRRHRRHQRPRRIPPRLRRQSGRRGGAPAPAQAARGKAFCRDGREP